MPNKKGYCLILEGGGAKTAYGVGVLSYLEQKGFKYSAIAGASFGALNGALYLEGGIKRLYDFYNNFETSDIYLDQEMERAVREFDGEEDLLKILLKTLPRSTTNYSQMSDNYHNFIMSTINEKEIRNNKTEFVFPITRTPPLQEILPKIALSVLSGTNIMKTDFLSLGMSGEIIEKDKCPEGSLGIYLAATTNYPVFKPIMINGNYYVDGGIYDNVPYKIMMEKGYTKFIIIRANPGKLPSFIEDNPDNLIFTPSSPLGSVADFARNNFMSLMARGYQDAKQYLDNKKRKKTL